jgi:hypothetical protein
LPCHQASLTISRKRTNEVCRRDQVGETVVLNGYDEDEMGELEFADREGAFHTIWVEPKFIESKKKS